MDCMGAVRGGRAGPVLLAGPTRELVVLVVLLCVGEAVRGGRAGPTR